MLTGSQAGGTTGMLNIVPHHGKANEGVLRRVQEGRMLCAGVVQVRRGKAMLNLAWGKGPARHKVRANPCTGT